MPRNGRKMMKIDQRALLPPDRSWLRMMSLKITMIIQIQITNMKNQSIDQSTWPVPHSAAIIMSNVTFVDWFEHDGRRSRMTTAGAVVLPMRTETRIPIGNTPQYPTARPTLPMKSISSQVAGNVASRKTMSSPSSPLIMMSSFISAADLTSPSKM